MQKWITFRGLLSYRNVFVLEFHIWFLPGILNNYKTYNESCRKYQQLE